MEIAQNTLRKLIQALAVIAFVTASASTQAQMPMPSISLQGEPKRKLTPEEQERQDALDKAYKSATNKIPDQKMNDPWATVRPQPSAPAPKKKPQ
jgi:hypothetical protein